MQLLDFQAHIRRFESRKRLAVSERVFVADHDQDNRADMWRISVLHPAGRSLTRPSIGGASQKRRAFLSSMT
jgi:hypothetical protein